MGQHWCFFYDERVLFQLKVYFQTILQRIGKSSKFLILRLERNFPLRYVVFHPTFTLAQNSDRCLQDVNPVPCKAVPIAYLQFYRYLSPKQLFTMSIVFYGLRDTCSFFKMTSFTKKLQLQEVLMVFLALVASNMHPPLPQWPGL